MFGTHRFVHYMLNMLNQQCNVENSTVGPDQFPQVVHSQDQEKASRCFVLGNSRLAPFDYMLQEVEAAETPCLFETFLT